MKKAMARALGDEIRRCRGLSKAQANGVAALDFRVRALEAICDALLSELGGDTFVAMAEGDISRHAATFPKGDIDPGAAAGETADGVAPSADGPAPAAAPPSEEAAARDLVEGLTRLGADLGRCVDGLESIVQGLRRFDSSGE